MGTPSRSALREDPLTASEGVMRLYNGYTERWGASASLASEQRVGEKTMSVSLESTESPSATRGMKWTWRPTRRRSAAFSSLRRRRTSSSLDTTICIPWSSAFRRRGLGGTPWPWPATRLRRPALSSSWTACGSWRRPQRSSTPTRRCSLRASWQVAAWRTRSGQKT